MTDDDARPIRIDADSSWEGVAAEHRWLEARFGKMGEDWFPVMQVLERPALSGGGRAAHDVIRIRLRDGMLASVRFDITTWFGKESV